MVGTTGPAGGRGAPLRGGTGTRFVVGALIQARGAARGYALLVETPAEFVLGATGPAGDGGIATDAEATKGRLVFAVLCEEAGSNRGYRPILARWRSTAAIVVAVITSIVNWIEGSESTLGAGGLGGGNSTS